MLAARVRLIACTNSDPQAVGQGLVRAIWTDNDALSARIDLNVAHYTGQAELAHAIQDMLGARKAVAEGASGQHDGGHVFLSYVREDDEVVERLERDLVEAGIKIWRDRTSLGPGVRWKDTIREAIASGS